MSTSIDAASLLTPRAKGGRWLLAAAIAGSALAVGSVHTIALCAVTALLTGAAFLGWWGADPMKTRSAATLLLFTGAALTAYTALQCVPVPIRWLAVLAPHNADVWARALAPLHESGPAWAPISVDPTGTRIEVLKGVAYLLAFVTALRVARRREGVGFLSGVVVVTGMALALTAVLHPAFGAHKLFGMYEPAPGIAQRHIAPLLNPNNLAGYLNLAMCLALAATLAPEPRVPRAVMAAVVLLLGAAQVWVASRGGVGAMAVGVLVVIVIARLARAGKKGGVVTASVIVGIVTAAGSVLMVLGGSQEASSELLDADASKLKMFGRMMRMLPDVPFFGCGRGAFESAFPAFRADFGHVTYTHPENVVAQWVLEWGLPVGVAGLTAVAVALRPTEMFARSTTAAGAWAGLVALAVQNLGDLGTEVPGLMLAAVMCAAMVVAGTPGRAQGWRGARWASFPRVVAAVAVVAATVALVAAGAGIGRELAEDRRHLHDAALDPNLPALGMHGLARAAMLRHPAEPYLPFAAGLHALHQRDESAIPWMGATLERAPIYAPAHLILARAVGKRSPSQARTEYRLSMEQAPDLVGIVMVEAPHLVERYDDAMELVPVGKDGIPVLAALVDSLQSRLPASGVRLDAELASRAPNQAGPVLRAAGAAVEDVERTEHPAWCDGPARKECVSRALELVEHAKRMSPSSCASRALAAHLQVAIGNVAGGLKELSAAADEVTERVQCLRELAVLAAQVGDAARETEAITRIASAGCTEDAECVRNFSWIGALEEGRGNTRHALALYKRAYERAPEDDGLLEALARLAATTGLHAEAAEDYERLAQRHPAQEKWKIAAQFERDEAVKRAVRL